MSYGPRIAPQRFRGDTASSRSQHVVSGIIVASVCALLLAGLLGGAGSRPVFAIMTFFAVGAGAGYSLSGSV